MKAKIDQKLVMTLLVRDEEDIIEQCIKFHLNQGVDFIIATDNGSIDGTKDILLKYKEMRLLHLIEEPEHNYNQPVWVNNMIEIARDKYDATWIMNVDADEFWFSTFGDLKLSLPTTKECNVLKIGSIQIDPVDSYENGLFKIPKTISGIVTSHFKCMHTAKGYKRILMGNHEVKMKRFNRKKMITSDIIIFHFANRSYQQFENKVVKTVKALDNNPDFVNKKHIGEHIRIHYEKYKEGKLRQSYDDIKIENSKNKHYIENDSRLFDYVENGYRSIDSIMNKDFNLSRNRIK